MIFIFKKRPFTPAETERMASWAEAQPVIVPGRHVEPPYAALSGPQELAEYDARPRPASIPCSTTARSSSRPSSPGACRAGCATVRDRAAGSAARAAGVAFGKPRGERAAPYAGSIAYFACLGLGFIAVELALLQDLTLLLGHPIFTLSILLFTLLASGGLGSWPSGRFRLGRVCLATVAVRGRLRAGAAARGAGAAAAAARRPHRDRDRCWWRRSAS